MATEPKKVQQMQQMQQMHRGLQQRGRLLQQLRYLHRA
jgi:hypothetical protein